MDADLILIFAFVLTMLVIMLTFGTIAGQRSRAHKERRLELQARAEEAKAEQLRYANGDHAAIEQRLRVLERIATDRGADLAIEIEHLRDRHRAGEQVQ